MMPRVILEDEYFARMVVRTWSSFIAIARLNDESNGSVPLHDDLTEMLTYDVNFDSHRAKIGKQLELRSNCN
jgi:hypothetical protein